MSIGQGRRVGVSVGGHGVPLVFLHGLGLHGRAYVRLLSRLGGLGFMVIALDAAGHGGTPHPARDESALQHRVDLTLRTLDALGVRRAVFLGHSMGGRMIVDLASRAPRRVLAAVLLNAAAGAPFDRSAAARSPREMARRLLAAAVDAHGDPVRLLLAERARYLRFVAGALAHNVMDPLSVTGAVRAIVGSGDFTPRLAAMRRQRVPTIVVHSEKDGVVPFENAHDMAERTDGALYRVPGAHHSWLLANPRQAADMVRQLMDAELGVALQRAASEQRIRNDADAWNGAMLDAGSPLLDLNEGRGEQVGVEESEVVELERLRTAPALQPSPAGRTGRLRGLWARRARRILVAG